MSSPKPSVVLKISARRDFLGQDGTVWDSLGQDRMGRFGTGWDGLGQEGTVRDRKELLRTV